MKYREFFVICIVIALILVPIATACAPKPAPQPPAPAVQPAPAKPAPVLPKVTTAPAKPAPVPAKPTTAPPKPAPPRTAPKKGVTDFYKGKSVKLLVGSSPGGGNDMWSRLIAPYLGKYTGATVVVVNMGGGGGIKMWNHLQNSAKPDGRTLGFHLASVAGLNQILIGKGVKFDLRELAWIGQVTPLIQTVVASSKYKSVQDILAAKEPVKAGTDSLTSASGLPFIILAESAGWNLKIIPGFKGTSEAQLAMLRGEIDLQNKDIISFLPYIKEGKMNPIMVTHLERDPRTPDVPAMPEIMKMTKLQRDLISFLYAGRVMLAPPKVSADRLDFLREALRKTMADKELIAKIKSLHEQPGYLPAKEAKALVEPILNMSASEVDELKKLIKKYQ